MTAVAVLSDTHERSDAGLAGRAQRAVREADRVLHAGDFTTAAVLDALHEESGRLDAVCGNSDDAAVRDRLPAARTVTVEGVRVALTHRQAAGETGLAMFGRERGADVVVSGHTHRPQVRTDRRPVLLNPGSHAAPRGGQASHAELEVADGTVRGTVRSRDGSVLGSFEASVGGEN
ncbi:MAG: metallophosphoesterase [Halobacteriaceae archaeon]